MNKFKSLIALSYFAQSGTNYSLDSLQKILGMDFKNFLKFLTYLSEEKLIRYDNFMIKNTDKARRFLKENRMHKFNFAGLEERKADNARNIAEENTDVYIPENFIKD